MPELTAINFPDFPDRAGANWQRLTLISYTSLAKFCLPGTRNIICINILVKSEQMDLLVR